MHKWEQGNYAQLAGVCATTLPNLPDGSIDLRQMEEAIYVGDDSHCAQTRMIALENTMNYRGGRVLSLEYMSKVRAIADRHNLRVHVDGARLFNAAIALKTTPKRLVQDADSVQMCLSKGLGAPIGSILCGDEQFINRARRARKALGGGWRQAGILAAAAMVALDKAEETVTRDNENARRLGLGLNNLNSSTFHVDMDTLETNIVMVMVKGITADEVCDKLALREPPILAMSMDTYRIRMVTNWDVNTEQIDQVIDAFAHLSEH